MRDVVLVPVLSRTIHGENGINNLIGRPMSEVCGPLSLAREAQTYTQAFLNLPNVHLHAQLPFDKTMISVFQYRQEEMGEQSHVSSGN